ncbi:MAG: TRAP transporter substrate-binding protein, partial [Magnetococcales bacterium]|nr:TRAP transporter substrate-binding protein [Magnetococcales bacterium]
MRRTLILLPLVAALAFVGWVWWPLLHPSPEAVPEAGGKAPPVVLRFGHNMPAESALGLAAAKFAQEIEAGGEGRLRVEVLPGGRVGNDLEMIERTVNGELDILLVPTAKMSVPIPAMQYPDLPFHFASPEELFRLLDGPPGELILAKLHAIGLVGVTFWGNGFKQFTANRPIHAPEDFAGLKVRVMKSRLIMDQFASLGAVPIPIEFRETRQALADGVVEAQENPLAAIAAMGIHEVQSHLTLSDHAYLAYVLAFSEKSFARLGDAAQSRLLATARELTPWQRQETARQEERILDRIEAAGVLVNRLSEAERAKFAERLRHLPLQFEAVIGSDILSKGEEMRRARRPSSARQEEILVGLDADFSQFPG